MAAIDFDNVTKVYGGGVTAVSNLSLTVQDGEFVVLLGPSGCGKSTALRMVAGLETITGGEIRIGGNVVNRVQPRDRDIAMVFQNYALYPHMDVSDNIGFGLRTRHVPKRERDERIEARRQRSRSFGAPGAQAQPVVRRTAPASAMGRAIVRKPKAFLWTSRCRTSMLGCASKCARRSCESNASLKVTTLYVTHDQIEAMTMADRVAVHAGRCIAAVRHARPRLHPPGQPCSSRASSVARQ